MRNIPFEKLPPVPKHDNYPFRAVVPIWYNATTKELARAGTNLPEIIGVPTPAVATDDAVLVRYLFPHTDLFVCARSQYEAGDLRKALYLPMVSELLSVPEAAALAEVTTVTIRNWVQLQRLSPFHTRRGALRISRDELERLVK